MYLQHRNTFSVSTGIKSLHVEIVKNVDHLLKLNKQLSETKLPSKQDQLNSRIAHHDAQIDECVYELGVYPPLVEVDRGGKKDCGRECREEEMRQIDLRYLGNPANDTKYLLRDASGKNSRNKKRSLDMKERLI